MRPPAPRPSPKTPLHITRTLVFILPIFSILLILVILLFRLALLILVILRLVILFLLLQWAALGRGGCTLVAAPQVPACTLVVVRTLVAVYAGGVLVAERGPRGTGSGCLRGIALSPGGGVGMAQARKKPDYPHAGRVRIVRTLSVGDRAQIFISVTQLTAKGHQGLLVEWLGLRVAAARRLPRLAGLRGGALAVRPIHAPPDTHV